VLKKLLPLFAGLLLSLSALAGEPAEIREDHPDSYVVKRGDTLWDIAARFLKKPWLWPEVWQANPQVKNPHLVYPGDVITLAYFNGQPRLSAGSTPAGKANDRPRVRTTPLEEAVKPVPLSELKNYLHNMRLLDEAAFKQAPHVVAIEENQLRGSHGNLVYVRGLDTRQGTQFALARPTTVYHALPPAEKGQPPRIAARSPRTPFDGEVALLWSHGSPETHFAADGKTVGYEVFVFGQGEVTRVGETSSLLVTYADFEVRAGDLIVPIEDKPYDSQYYPHPPKQMPADLSVINFTDALASVGSKQVVVLSRGELDGVDNGQTFTVYRPGVSARDEYKYPRQSTRRFLHPDASTAELPEEFVGHVMVFRTFDRISYGLVMDGLRPVRLGDRLREPD